MNTKYDPKWVEQYFGPIPPGEPVAEVSTWVPEMTSEKRVRIEDRVELTRVYYLWHSAPYYHEGDADLDLAGTILGGGRSSRLYRRLVHETKLAQEVFASQMSQQLSSIFYVEVTIAPGADPAEVGIELMGEIAVGKFIDVDKPTFMDQYRGTLEASAGKGRN